DRVKDGIPTSAGSAVNRDELLASPPVHLQSVETIREPKSTAVRVNNLTAVVPGVVWPIELFVKDRDGRKRSAAGTRLRIRVERRGVEMGADLCSAAGADAPHLDHLGHLDGRRATCGVVEVGTVFEGFPEFAELAGCQRFVRPIGDDVSLPFRRVRGQV